MTNIFKSTEQKKTLIALWIPLSMSIGHSLVPSNADVDIAAYAIGQTSNALRSTVQQSVNFEGKYSTE